jgi:hypothetical protein
MVLTLIIYYQFSITDMRGCFRIFGSLHELVEDPAPAFENKKMSFTRGKSRLSVGDFISQVYLKPDHSQFMLAASWTIESMSDVPLKLSP